MVGIVGRPWKTQDPMSEFRFGGLVLRTGGRTDSTDLSPDEMREVESDLWLAVNDPLGLHTLARFLDATTGFGDDQVLEVVLERIREGRISVEYERNRTVDPSLGLAAVTLMRLAEAEPINDEDFSVAIELIGEDHEPLAGIRYRLELPDGKISEGVTGDDGQAFLWGLTKAGDCKLTFPDLDTEAWESVESTPL